MNANEWHPHADILVELDEGHRRWFPVMDVAACVQCPDCFGKGLQNQDDRPGILLGPLGELPCRRCGGRGFVSA